MSKTGSNWITIQQRSCPLPLPYKHLLVQPGFLTCYSSSSFSYPVLVLLSNKLLLVCHGDFICHLSDSEQNTGSGDEPPGVESEFFHLLCMSLDQLHPMFKVSKLEFPLGCTPGISWILNRMICLSCLVCSRYLIDVIAVVV